MISKVKLGSWLAVGYKSSKSRKSIFGKGFLRQEKKGKKNKGYALKHF